MALAIISMYSEPNSDLLRVSHRTFVSCQYFGDNALVVVEVLCIESVVAMVPHNPAHSIDSENHFFLVEQPRLDTANLGGTQEAITET